MNKMPTPRHDFTTQYKCHECGLTFVVNWKYLTAENKTRLDTILSEFVTGNNEASHICRGDDVDA